MHRHVRRYERDSKKHNLLSRVIFGLIPVNCNVSISHCESEYKFLLVVCLTLPVVWWG